MDESVSYRNFKHTAASAIPARFTHLVDLLDGRELELPRGDTRHCGVDGGRHSRKARAGYESGGGWRSVGDMTEGGDSGYMLVGLQFRVCIFVRSWGDYMRTPNSRVFVAIEER